MNVQDLCPLPLENAGEPSELAPSKRRSNIVDWVLCNAAAVVDSQACLLEEGWKTVIMAEQRHRVRCVGSLRPRCEVDEKPLGAADRAGDDQMNHPDPFAHGCYLALRLRRDNSISVVAGV